MAAANDDESVLFDKNEYRAKLYEHLSELTKQVNFVNYPINPKISYDYPDLNEIVLVNIMNALVVFPKFYTQVLHLMNKMNLPCPLVGQVRKYDKPTVLNELKRANKLHLIKLNLGHLNESINAGKEAPKVKPLKQDSIVEEEDDDEEQDEAHDKKTSPADFTKDLEKKKFTLKSLAKPPVSATCAPKSTYDLNDVFESKSKNVLTKRKINIAEGLKTTTLQAQPEAVASPASLFSPSTTTCFITSEELEAKRLKMAELRELPVFKNYHLGERCNKIYIKNVAKKVQDLDLRHVYGRYVDWSAEADKSAFEIRLMKEGRMKGQAFVTFASEESAERAVNETNGLVLDGKPIVVQYGRSTASK